MKRPDNFARHPVQFLRELRHRYGDGLELSFSRYRYKRRVREEVRRTFRVSVREVDLAWLQRQVACLAPGEELAFESRVRIGRSLRHVPMLDFCGMKPGHLAAVIEVLPKYKLNKPFVYFSGRSFHAYFPVLMTSRQWVKFMGSALLCNTPSHPRVVDQRWVGHRLIGGYAALRWSWNTDTYKAMPRRVPATALDWRS